MSPPVSPSATMRLFSPVIPMYCARWINHLRASQTLQHKADRLHHHAACQIAPVRLPFRVTCQTLANKHAPRQKVRNPLHKLYSRGIPASKDGLEYCIDNIYNSPPGRFTPPDGL